jgi:hypothetical protein
MIDWPLLLAALIAVESGGDVNAIGDNGRAIGCLQIHPIMVDECNRILHRKFGPLKETDFRFTLKHRQWESTSRNMAICYLRYWGSHYKQKHGKEPTYEVYARLWNGGPKGYAKPATEAYWRKVKAAMLELRNKGERD